MRLFHCCSVSHLADRILEAGFDDRHEIEIHARRRNPGVLFFTDQALACGDSKPGTIIAVDVPAALAEKYRIHKENAPGVAAQFLIPATLLNDYPRERVS